MAEVKIEEKKYGVIFKMEGCNFFVSEDVIPVECKIFHRGVLQSFNFKGIKKSDLIVKEIFRKTHVIPTQLKTDITDIKDRMYALFYILEFDFTNGTHFEKNIYKSALLGAIASLFSAFDKNTNYNNILNDQFRRKFRNTIYHLDCVFERTPVSTLKILILHFYEHCRSELSDHHDFPSVSNHVNEDEKLKLSFSNLLVSCLNIQSIYYEWKESVIIELAEKKENLSNIIQYFNKNPESHSLENFPREKSLAIRGNAIGLYIAQLSGAAMSLLKGRAYQTSENDEIENASLTKEQKKEIEEKYGNFIQIGSAFRHNEILYSTLTEKFNIKIPECTQPSQQSNFVANHFGIFSIKNKAVPKEEEKIQLISKLNMPTEKSVIGILPNGDIVSEDHYNKTISILDNETNKCKHEINMNFAMDHFCYAGRRNVVLLKNNFLAVALFQYIHIFNIKERSQKTLIQKDGGVFVLLEMPDGRLATGNGGNMIYIWNIDTGKCEVALVADGGGSVCALTLSPSGQLVSGGNNGIIQIWNIEDAKCEKRLEVICQEKITASYVSHTGCEVRSHFQDGGSVTSLVISENGQIIAGYGDKKIRVWDIHQEKYTRIFVGHEAWPNGLILLSNGHLISASTDGALSVWSNDTCLLTMKLNHEIDQIKLIDGSRLCVINSREVLILKLSELILKSSLQIQRLV